MTLTAETEILGGNPIVVHSVYHKPYMDNFEVRRPRCVLNHSVENEYEKQS
jgi:hypothetical protein